MIVTFVERVLCKIVVDFTLIVQFRHQFEFGGAYWSFNVFSNQVFCFISVYLYAKYSDTNNGEVVEVLWKLVTGLFIFSMLLDIFTVSQEFQPLLHIKGCTLV